MENAKIEKFKCDILSNFQTLCMLSFCNITNQNPKCDILCNFPTLYISVAQFLMDLSGEILLGAFPETNYGQKLAQGH